jgi:hypothetical protein
MKKLIVVLVALVLTVGFSIGCGKKAEPTPPPVTQPEVNAPVTTPAGDAAAPAAPAPETPAK